MGLKPPGFFVYNASTMKTLSELVQNLPDVIRVSGDAEITAPVAESDEFTDRTSSRPSQDFKVSD